ncbi:MAG: putative GTP pyrophosphokinase [Prokaryotic dsDNA virus sp.]|nr:MAG: putative GTP pyrophosphokinase [Prokaryotic dsDNA virus sp.]|tara:strand:+ start:3607 stop:4116 length:510 start_codon:yes stop_codon:yes gene_type:complete
MNLAQEIIALEMAEELALEAHQGQEYGNLEYGEHLADVACTVQRLVDQHFSDSIAYDPTPLFKMLQVAWLHDILEDTYITEDILRAKGFEEDVITSVQLVTKEEGYDYNEYIERIKTDQKALVVKLADTISNLSFSMVNGDSRRIAKYRKQYDLLFLAFSEGLVKLTIE